MSIQTLKSEAYRALMQLEKRQCYTDKERNLDFNPDPLFPDWWQILLESVFARLFEPNLAASLAEEMIDSSNLEVKLLGHVALIQTSLLHPNIVKPIEVVKLPIFDARLVSNLILKDNKNYCNYANSRLLLLALAKSHIDSIKYTIELNLLEPFIDSRYLKVANALQSNNNQLLEHCCKQLLGNPDHRFFYYWWDIFFETHLFNQKK
jgi:hypothetical protein